MINKFPTALPHISRLKNTTLLDNTKNSFPGGSVVKNPPANAGDMGSIPGLGSSPGKGNGNPLQYSCLENAMDKGDWWGYSPWGGKRFRHDLETKQHNKHSTTLKTIPCCCCCCCFFKETKSGEDTKLPSAQSRLSVWKAATRWERKLSSVAWVAAMPT